MTRLNDHSQETLTCLDSWLLCPKTPSNADSVLPTPPALCLDGKGTLLHSKVSHGRHIRIAGRVIERTHGCKSKAMTSILPLPSAPSPGCDGRTTWLDPAQWVQTRHVEDQMADLFAILEAGQSLMLRFLTGPCLRFLFLMRLLLLTK